MRTVEMDQVTNLPGLLKEALNGEPFIIAQNGEPVLRVTAIEKEKREPSRRIGFLKGVFTIPDDFGTMADQEFAEMMTIIEEKQF